MIVEVDIPKKLLNKIRALNVLMGESSASVEDSVIKIMDAAVSGAILEQLEMDDAPIPQSRAQKRHYAARDESGVSDGLGDLEELEADIEESMPGPVNDMYDLIPKGLKGLSDEAMDDDMSVGDPDHEAKADASAFDDMPVSRAEEVFSQLTGIPLPVEEEAEEEDERITKRRKKYRGRARVAPLEQDSQLYDQL